MDSSISSFWTSRFLLDGMSGYFTMFIEKSVFNANSEDPDQMPHSVASDPGLYCLQMSFYGTLCTNGSNIGSRQDDTSLD